MTQRIRPYPRFVAWSVRRLEAGATPAVVDVFTRSRAGAMPWLPVLHTSEEDAAYFTAQIATSQAWGVLDGPALVGFAVGRGDWLDHLYVHPDWQGRGVGSTLLEHVWAQTDGGLQLWAFQANVAALDFYRRHGFEVVESTDGSGNEERTPDVRMQRGVLVRPARPADAEALADVHVRSWRAGYAGLVPDEVLAGLDVQKRARLWGTRLVEPEPRILVADTGTAVVGFVSHGPARDEDLQAQAGRWWEVYALYVAPEWWGNGVGGRLWRAAAEAAPPGACCRCVWVLAGNARGRAAYGAWGLAPDGATTTWESGSGGLPEVRYVRCDGVDGHEGA